MSAQPLRGGNTQRIPVRDVRVLHAQKPKPLSAAEARRIAGTTAVYTQAAQIMATARRMGWAR